jgi:hypothetical protein
MKNIFPVHIIFQEEILYNKYEFDDEHCKFNSMGIALRRRDNVNQNIFMVDVSILFLKNMISKNQLDSAKEF